MIHPLTRSAAILVALAATNDGHATVLTFDQTRDAISQSLVVPTSAGAAVQQDYGDRVTDAIVSVPGGQFTYGNDGEGYTPNIVVDYFATTGVNLWTTQYGDLSNVVFAHAPLAGGQSVETLSVRLSADPGYAVLLYHFDLAGWPNADYTIKQVRVLDGATRLFAQDTVQVEGDFLGPRHTAFDFATPLHAAQLLIEIDLSNLPGGTRDNIGLDNIRFGQIPPVPVPATLWLFGSGALGLVAVMRRRHGDQR